MVGIPCGWIVPAHRTPETGMAAALEQALDEARAAHGADCQSGDYSSIVLRGCNANWNFVSTIREGSFVPVT
jgi:hypothetical protein